MSKQIFPRDLAEIITGLLIKPELLGELDSPDKHQAFMRDIGKVVSDHCGGRINWINECDKEDDYLSDQDNSPSLSVSPDRNLPGLHHNVWAYHSPFGWEEEVTAKGESDLALSAEIISKTRCELQCLLINSALPYEAHFNVVKKVVDCRTDQGSLPDEPGTDRLHAIKADIGNQTSTGMVIDINGFPVFYLDQSAFNSILHIHATNEGLVITIPDLDKKNTELMIRPVY